MSASVNISANINTNINVLITRTPEQSIESVNRLSSEGLFSFCLPMIITKSVMDDNDKFSSVSYDYCILTSPTAVRYFSGYYNKLNIKQYVAVGSATSEAMTQLLGTKESEIMIPPKFYMAEIAKIMNAQNLVGKKIVAPGAKVRVTDMVGFFTERGAIYEAPTLYETVGLKYPEGYIDNFLVENNINAVTFFSPSGVDSFMSQLIKPIASITNSDMEIFAIGTTTAKSLAKYGVTPIISDEQTADSVVDAVKKWAGK